MISKSYWQTGQMGLVVLLILVVMSTVGVSVATRSVSELRLSRQEQESTKALNAAEAGIEEALTQKLRRLGKAFSYTATMYDNNSLHNNVDEFKLVILLKNQHSIDNQPVAAGHTMDVNLDGHQRRLIPFLGLRYR
jgi:Tfp pilus assembly protein PilX